MPGEIAVITSVVSALLGVLGALTNGLVMYIIMQINKFKEIQNMDILILSLCFSDFLYSIATQSQVIPRILARSRIPAEQSLAIHVTVHFTIISGSLSLLFLTLNRYLSVKFPFFYESNVTEKKTYGCLASIYTIAIAIVIWVLLDGQSEVRMFPVIVSIIISFTVIFQVMIFAIVQAQNRNMRQQIMAVQYNQSGISQMTRRTNAQRSKTNRTILYICAVYIAVWLPSIIFRLYYVIHGNLTFYIQWVHLFNVVIQLHSCINPFLYVLRTSRVKQICIRIFRRE
jgi:hypothetical protein